MSDKRETVKSPGDFYPIIQELYASGEKAAILYEDSGVTRASGLITALYEQDGQQWMQLNSSINIEIKQLYAVNGTFTSDYSEC